MSKSNHKVVRVSENDDDLVGIQSRVEEVEKLLGLGSNEVRFVGICGMVGIGKSTVAAALFNKISHQFDASCFLRDISREINDRPHDLCLSELREQLLRETLEQEYEKVRDAHHGRLSIRASLCYRRVLIVLDDIDKLTQLEALGRKRDWFGARSKIIITTRDEQILKLHGVRDIYRVKPLNKNEAQRLFCRKAFGRDYPIKDYDQQLIISNELKNAKGLPLTIESLGSSLYNRCVSEWTSALAKQKEIVDDFILKEVKRSFDGLHEMEKQILLDIACFFVGKKINYVKRVLSGYEIGVLVEKSLITISNEKIQMHYTMQELGKEIVRQESPNNPGRRSRLWLYNDFRYVMETNIGTKYVEAIVLNEEDQKDLPKTSLRIEGLSQMKGLRLLILRDVKFSGVLDSLSNHLRYISWHKYHCASLPSSFEPYNLVELIMPESNIEQLWQGLKKLPKLRNLDLGGSRKLMQTPDFGGLRNLERLDLEGCAVLSQLDGSIEKLQKLRFLNLRNCKRLESIPNSLFGGSSLETINLAGCSKLAECLDQYNSWKSSIEAKLLIAGIQHYAFLATLICFFFISLPKVVMNHKWIFCSLICLIYSIYYVRR